jgi:protein transport protein SEC13
MTVHPTVAAVAAAVPLTNDGSKKGPIYVDTQHDDMIHDAQMDYYGTKLATSSSDRTVKIYDVNGDSYTHTATLQGHGGPVWSVSWSHPKFGIVLASSSFDGSVMIHRESRPREWTMIHNARNLHDSSVNSIQFAPHQFGLVLAAASSDGKVSVLTHGQDDSWNVEYFTDNSLGANALSFGPYSAYSSSQADGDANATSNQDPANASANNYPSSAQHKMHIVTGGCDNRIRFWNKSANSQQWEIDSSVIDTSSISHTDWVRDVSWAPSIVPNTNIVASCSEDRTVIIWTQKGGQGHAWKPVLLNTFSDPVWRVSWSVTGSILAVSSGDNNVTLWKQTMEGTWVQVSSVQDGN